MHRLVCAISGRVCYDASGVRAHVATLEKLKLACDGPSVYRCPHAAVQHPDRPYHVGRQRNLHSVSEPPDPKNARTTARGKGGGTDG